VKIFSFFCDLHQHFLFVYKTKMQNFKEIHCQQTCLQEISHNLVSYDYQPAVCFLPSINIYSYHVIINLLLQEVAISIILRYHLMSCHSYFLCHRHLNLPYKTIMFTFTMQLKPYIYIWLI